MRLFSNVSHLNLLFAQGVVTSLCRIVCDWNQRGIKQSMYFFTSFSRDQDDLCITQQMFLDTGRRGYHFGHQDTVNHSLKSLGRG